VRIADYVDAMRRLRCHLSQALVLIDTDPEEQPVTLDLTLDKQCIALSALSLKSQYARDDPWPGSHCEDLELNAERFLMQDASHWGLVLNQHAPGVTIPMILTSPSP